MNIYDELCEVAKNLDQSQIKLQETANTVGYIRDTARLANFRKKELSGVKQEMERERDKIVGALVQIANLKNFIWKLQKNDDPN